MREFLNIKTANNSIMNGDSFAREREKQEKPQLNKEQVEKAKKAKKKLLVKEQIVTK